MNFKTAIGALSARKQCDGVQISLDSLFQYKISDFMCSRTHAARYSVPTGEWPRERRFGEPDVARRFLKGSLHAERLFVLFLDGLHPPCDGSDR